LPITLFEIVSLIPENIFTIVQQRLLSTNKPTAQLTGLPVGGTGSWTVTFNIRQAFLADQI